MNRFQPQNSVISKPSAVSLASLSINNSSFVALVADPAGADQKIAELWVNGAAKQQWVSGSTTTFYHTNSNLRMDANGNFFPVTDNIVSLGANGNRWTAVWAANGTIQTSDPRTKSDIQDSALGLNFINKLRPVSYKFKVGGNRLVEEKIVKEAEYDENGNLIRAAITEKVIEPFAGKRTHYGLLTTNVKESLGDLDFGGYIKTNLDDPESEEALRYDEFIAPLIKAVQELSAEVESLKSKLS
jgi:hypothetical protein